MQTLNKGEWSEAYCILKIISDRKLFLCKTDLNVTGDEIVINGGVISPIISYRIDGDNVTFNINENYRDFSLEYVSELAKRSFDFIKSSSEKTFSIPEFSELFDNYSLKAKASDKVDTIINVFDNLTNTNEELGFSIKSFVSSSPTLVNASRATNFVYEVKLNSIEEKYQNLKAKKLLRSLKENNVSILFSGMDSAIYKNNLMKIDLQLPEILAEFLKIYFSSQSIKVADITSILQESNPLKIDNISLYKDKITDFLFYSAVGLFPNKDWQGMQDIDGGCLIVENNGDIKSFYIFRKSFLGFFREYLFNKCFLDTASTTRHKFSQLYNENGQVKLKLNLQIRIAR